MMNWFRWKCTEAVFVAAGFGGWFSGGRRGRRRVFGGAAGQKIEVRAKKLKLEQFSKNARLLPDFRQNSAFINLAEILHICFCYRREASADYINLTFIVWFWSGTESRVAGASQPKT